MVYLVWERESYCDYDVILVTNDKEIAQKLVEDKNSEHEYERCWIDKRQLILKEYVISNQSLNNGNMFT